MDGHGLRPRRDDDTLVLACGIRRQHACLFKSSRIGCENSLLFETHTVRTRIMEAERINLIGTQLSDLSARTLDLRGYL
ncbi:MAG: hypothetical protein ACI9I0_001949 [Rhodoferax sp.]|jgi:hypothetical protein